MPKGIYKRTEKHRGWHHSEKSIKQMSDTKKKNFAEGKTIPWSKGKKVWAGNIHPNSGKPRSEEVKIKIKKANKERHLSPSTEFKKCHVVPEEWRKKIPLFKKDQIPWNKNTKGIVKPNKGSFKKDSIPWNKNKKGIIPWIKGKHHTEATKQLLREKRLKLVIPKKDTLPERMLQQKLIDNGIIFEKHKPILGQPDIFIESNICVFVDGCYWHGCEQCFDRNSFIDRQRTQILKDRVITQKLTDKGYVVLRFWEHEIHGNIDSCMKTIRLNRLRTALKCPQCQLSP